jgi:hypothetical protein
MHPFAHVATLPTRDLVLVRAALERREHGHVDLVLEATVILPEEDQTCPPNPSHSHSLSASPWPNLRRPQARASYRHGGPEETCAWWS